MLDYAARRPAVAPRGSSPNAMLAIIALHIAALAALVSARMDLPPRIISEPIKIDLIREDDPPPPVPEIKSPPAAPSPSQLTRTPAIVPTPAPDLGSAIVPVPMPDLTKLIGPALDPGPVADPQPPLAARLLTAGAELKPPYPRSKLLGEEQAVLRLRLTIDARGRVVAVEPVGRADPAFLAAARSHILARWRYRPASENGQAIVSSAIVTLHFELDD